MDQISKEDQYSLSVERYYWFEIVEPHVIIMDILH